MEADREKKLLQEAIMALIEAMVHTYVVPMPEQMYDPPDSKFFTSEGENYANLCALRFAQALTFSNFLNRLADHYMQLATEPRKAEEISRKGLEELKEFMEECKELLMQEQNWQE